MVILFQKVKPNNHDVVSDSLFCVSFLRLFLGFLPGRPWASICKHWLWLHVVHDF